MAASNMIKPPGEEMLPGILNNDLGNLLESDADYELVSPNQMFANTSNLIPVTQSMKGARALISAKYLGQALPMFEQEAPYVDALDERVGEGYGKVLGKKLGFRPSLYNGEVISIGGDHVVIKDENGKRQKQEFYSYFPSAKKTYTTDKPLVKIGDKVKAGQPLARSNFVTDDGDLALGRNLRVAFMAAPEGTSFEDSIAVSQAAAEKLTSTHLYSHEVDTKHGTATDKRKFVSLFPNKFTKEQLAKLDENGMAKPGVVLEPGDPVVLSYRPRMLSSKDAALGSLSKVMKNSFEDGSLVWEKSRKGVVADVYNGRGTAKVNVATKAPLRSGDKLCMTPDHEVLTTDGWVPISDVEVGDSVYSIDPATGDISVEEVDDTYEFEVDENLYLLETTQVSMCVTDNHKLVAKPRGGPGRGVFGLHESKRMHGKRYSLLKNGTWKAPDLARVEIPGVSKPLVWDGDFYAWFCGVYLAEGKLTHIPSKGTYGVEITQRGERGVREIAARLDESGIEYSYNEKQGKFLLPGKTIYTHFLEFGQRAWLKKVPRGLFDTFSQRQVRLFIEGVMLGDGSVSQNDFWSCHTTSGHLAGDMQQAALLAGWSATVRKLRVGKDFKAEGGVIDGRQIVARRDRYLVSIFLRENQPTINHGHSETQGGQIEQTVHYRGKVYCISVPGNRTFYVRRNGKTHWTGNSARQGAKGVVGAVLPVDKMPRDADGNPVDIFINPAALIGRVNPAMVYEALLGKVAAKTGKRYVLPNFSDGSVQELVARELAENGISDTEALTDPVTGRTIEGVLTGSQYFMKLEHQSEDKLSGRNEGGVDINEQPTKGGKTGAKRLGGLMDAALIAHGATENLRDKQIYRGTKNADMWRAIRAGRPLPKPEVPFIYEKYLNTLRGAGIRVDEQPDKVAITAMTDKDVDELGAVEVNSAATIDEKTGEPIKGGLFDYSIFGGPQQKGWGVITLDEPMPNPIMEESLRSVLGITEKQLRDTMAGKRDIAGHFGAKGLLKALEGVDMDRLEEEAYNTVRYGRKTKRNDALKRLNAIRGLKTAGLKPSDLMVTRIPVLPPAYRPAVKMGDMTLVSDANYLYKDLLGAREVFRDNKKVLPDKELADERLAVYDSIKAIQGLGSPIHQETRDKGVKGFMQVITGAGKGPKTGLFSSKVLGHAVNTVGRSVIIPDSRLDMDHVGIPEKMAWSMYEPFVMGRMVKDGMQQTQAARELEKHSEIAKGYLLKEMEDRPVLYSRDPALHKFSIMGAHPVLVPGDSIRISPLVVNPFNADFDGNCITGCSKIYVALDNNLVNDAFMAKITTARVMARTGKTVVLLEIKDFPHLDTFHFDKNGAKVYDVPDGVDTLTVGDDGKGTRWSPVTNFTVEDGCVLKKVVTKGRREVVCSDNESLAVYEPGGRIGRIAPEGSVGRLIPVALTIPTVATPGRRGLPGVVGGVDPGEFGWLVGSFVSDGWTSKWNQAMCIYYSKSSDEKRSRVSRIIKGIAPGAKARDVDPGGQGFSEDRCKLKIYVGTSGGNGGKNSGGCLWDYLDSSMYHEDGPPEGGRRCLAKRLPEDVLSWPRKARLGILAGLIDGDGSLSVSNSKKRPQVMCNFSTSSPYLRDSVRMLCSSLGVRTSYTEVLPKKGRAQKHVNYVITISTVDLSKLADSLPVCSLCADGEAMTLLKEGVVKDDRDVVPVEFDMLDRITGKGAALRPDRVKPGTLNTLKSRARDSGVVLISRSLASDILRNYTGEVDEVFQALERVTLDQTVTWDPIESVTDAPTETVYDLCVPETKVFALESGLVIYDSMNIHLPVSPGAVKEVREKLMPSQNLFSLTDRSIHYKPSQEFILGLFNATQPAKGKEARQFKDEQEAIEAYQNNEIDIDTPVIIASS